jgi:hypothetical protein
LVQFPPEQFPGASDTHTSSFTASICKMLLDAAGSDAIERGQRHGERLRIVAMALW